MKILIYGAGVIGSIYAARLHEAGQDVFLLTRGEHYVRLQKNGILLRDTLTKKQTISFVKLTQQLKSDDFYNLIIITVRLDQIETIIPALKENIFSSLIMLMFNNPESADQLANELSPKHIIAGFPGVGGISRDNYIDYIRIKEQKTTIGELDGKISAHIKQIKKIFEEAGFKTTISNNIQDWLKIHAVFISCLSAAIILENGDSIQLGKKRGSIKIMVKSVREGFIACKSIGITISPANLKIIFTVMPVWFSVLYWQNAMKGKIGTLSIAPHANAAKNEMRLLAKKVLSMVNASVVPAPTLNKLLSEFIEHE